MRVTGWIFSVAWGGGCDDLPGRIVVGVIAGEILFVVFTRCVECDMDEVIVIMVPSGCVGQIHDFDVGSSRENLNDDELGEQGFADAFGPACQFLEVYFKVCL